MKANRREGQLSVVATVGTDHHPFDRMIAWLDWFAADHPHVSVFVQSGTAAPPRACAGTSYLAHDELAERMHAADGVVSHGGPATIMAARAAGRRPIVVPRRPELGEHVDDHQVRFGRWMAERDQIALAESQAAFDALLEAALADPTQYLLATDSTGAGAAGVRRFGELIDGMLA